MWWQNISREYTCTKKYTTKYNVHVIKNENLLQYMNVHVHVYHTVLPSDDVLTYIIYYMWCVHVAPKLPPPKLPIATFSFCNGGIQITLEPFPCTRQP